MTFRGYKTRINLLQKEILTAIALGQPLQEVMQVLCERVESIAPKVICSVLRVDNGSLQTLAAPSLTQEYCAAVNGILIGPKVGSCGTAAFFGNPIEVDDLASDPLWDDYKALAIAAGLRACWSFPIVSSGRVVGTFAFYSLVPRRLSKFERDVVNACVHLCAIAIADAEAREQIKKLAFSDHLTGLSNRAELRALAEGYLLEATTDGREIALFYMDMDGFKAVNDLHGHAAGDRVLQEVADRLRSVLPNARMLVRLGGDEFVALVNTNGQYECLELGRKIADGLAGRYNLSDDADVSLRVSIGIARCPTDGNTIDELLSHADTALYRSKRSSTAKFSFFDSSLRKDQLQRRSLERDIVNAVGLGQLSLVYQPIVNARSGRATGFEALMRWKHPTRGNVSPEDFIPAAEAVGAINDLGRFALTVACGAAATWSAPLRIAVNVSPSQITNSDFVRVVTDVLDRTALRADRLELEVTESLFIADSRCALRCLQDLKKLGVKIALDDFGTGFSSLGTLRSFPFDRLKIDRQFVNGMISNPEDAAIVRSVIALARAMNLEVVAEGVELLEHKTMLRMLGCDYLQGYLFGRPQAIGSFDTTITPDEVTNVVKYSPPPLVKAD